MALAHRLLIGLALALAAPVPAQQAVVVPEPPLPGIELISLSPDGTKFAAVISTDKQSQIQIRRVRGRGLVTASTAPRGGVRALTWAGPNHMIATVATSAGTFAVDGGRRDWSMLLDYDLGERRWTRLLDHDDDAMSVVSGPPTPITVDGRLMLAVPGFALDGNHGVSTLFRINLESNFVSKIEAGNRRTVAWLVDGEGRAVARGDFDSDKDEWSLWLHPDRQGWARSRQDFVADVPPGLIGLSRDSRSIVVAQDNRRGGRDVRLIAIADGTTAPPATLPGFDSPAIDPGCQCLVATAPAGSAELRFFDDRDQKIWSSIVQAFPGERIGFAGWSRDHQTIIITVNGAVHGDVYYVIDRRAKTADLLAGHAATP